MAETPDPDARSALGEWYGAAAAGTVLATLLALAPFFWPAFAIGAGAAATASLLLAFGSGRRRFGAAGSAYCLALAALAAAAWQLSTWLAGPDTIRFASSATVPLATLGAASALLVGLRVAGTVLLRRAARRLVESGLRSKLVAVRAAARALGTLRTVVSLFGRLTRVAGIVLAVAAAVALLALATLALNGLGVAQPVPWVGGPADVVLLAFVAATLVGFHALDAAESTVRTTREGIGLGRTLASEARETVRERRESGSEE